MGTTDQPGHRHGTQSCKEERHSPRSRKRHRHPWLPRTSDSDFTIELQPRSQPANSCIEATTAHATGWPHAQAIDSSDFDDEPHQGNMQDLRRPCPKSTSDTPGRTDYRSPRRDPSSSRRHHRCQTETSAPPQQTTRRRCHHPRQRCRNPPVSQS